MEGKKRKERRGEKKREAYYGKEEWEGERKGRQKGE